MTETAMSPKERLEWLILGNANDLYDINQRMQKQRFKYQMRLAGTPVDESPGTADEFFVQSFIRWGAVAREIYAQTMQYRAALEAL